MANRSVTLPDDLDDRMTDAVDYPDEKLSHWIRDAVKLRLHLENDREILADIDSDDHPDVE